MCHQISLLKLTFELFYALVWNLPICFPQNSKHLLIQSQFLGHFALVSSGIEVIYPQQILMVCSSCKTSYNIISHTHAITCGIGQFVRLLQSRRSTLKRGGGGGASSSTQLCVCAKIPLAFLVGTSNYLSNLHNDNASTGSC